MTIKTKSIIVFHKFWSGPVEGEGLGGGRFSPPPPPHFFENYKELLRKKCFQPPHFGSLVSPPTFKVAPRALLVVPMLDSTCTSSRGMMLSIKTTILKIFSPVGTTAGWRNISDALDTCNCSGGRWALTCSDHEDAKWQVSQQRIQRGWWQQGIFWSGLS